MRRDVEKNPLAALVKPEFGQLPTKRLMTWFPEDIGSWPDSKQTPVRVVGAKISTALLELMLVSIDS